MTAYTLPARLAIAISGWLLARAGVEWQLRPLRDKRGRFRPKDGGGYGLPKSIPHHVADLMHDMGVTQQMYETASVPLVLPDDLEDVPALENCLRMWILRNMDHWVNGKNRSVHGVMQALMCTWAITLYRFKPPKRMRGYRSERFQRVAEFKQNASPGHGARASCPPLTAANFAASSAEPADSLASDFPTLRPSDSPRHSDSPLGHSELARQMRAECPRSVPYRESLPESWRRCVVAVESPDPPRRGPPAPSISIYPAL